jgi:uncharacterized coiled-coil protein SlyX
VRQVGRRHVDAMARRIAGKWSAPPADPSSTGESPDPRIERRFEALEARVEHLETALEGLQDALYRQAIRQDDDTADLRRRTEPERIARALSADARRRGL